MQIKPFQVLETLLDRPGELVSREDLRQKLWPSGTFVDFESGLNTAMNRLRTALGDSADHPFYIETLPRMGYRFICPLEDKNKPARPTTHAAAEPFGMYLSRPRYPMLRSHLGAALVIVTILAAVTAVVSRPTPTHPPAAFRPISLRGGALLSARFLSGSKVIYSARVNDLRQSFVTNLDGGDSYPLGVGGIVAAASSRGDLALLATDPPGRGVHLLRSSLGAKESTRLADDVFVADWSPDGTQLAVVRQTGTESQLEFPRGKVIFRSQGWLDCLRVSRDGREVALLEHPVRDDDGGLVRLVTASGETRILSRDWSSAEGLAWSPSGREIWFTGSKDGVTRSLYSVSRFGSLRKLSNQPLSLRLLDVGPTGQALLAIDDMRMVLRTASLGQDAEISQFDCSHIDDMTHDGNVLLFTESGDAAGRHYSAYVYDRTSRRSIRFGPGRALSLSPDGKQAITIDPQDRTALTITSIDSGRSTRLSDRGFVYQWARFAGAGQILVGGSYPGGPLMIASQNTNSGKLTAFPSIPYLDDVVLSANGNNIAGRADGVVQISDLRTKVVRRLSPDFGSAPVAWSDDGQSLFLLTSRGSTYLIVDFKIATGQATAWKTLPAQDDATFVGLAGIAAAPDSDAYAYSANLKLSRLYLVDGLT